MQPVGNSDAGVCLRSPQRRYRMPIWEWVWHFSWLAAAYVFLWQVVRAARGWTGMSAPIDRSLVIASPVSRANGTGGQRQRIARFLVLRGSLVVRGLDEPIGSGEELQLPVAENGFRAGRSLENELQIPDPYVSSRHLRIYFEAGRVYVQDLNSRNGTLVNGKRLIGTAALDPEDEIRLGETRLRWLGWSDS